MTYNLEVSFHYFYLYLTLINAFEKDMSKVCKMSQIFEQNINVGGYYYYYIKKGILVPKKLTFATRNEIILINWPKMNLQVKI